MMWRRAAILLSLLSAVSSGHAQDALPIARVTIYPGDTITDSMIDERAYTLPGGSENLYVRSRDALIGKVARRTLLPNQPVPNIAVDNPRIVSVGAQIKIIFAEAGLHIVTYGIAQQNGAVGDLIRVRNQDSGLFIMGRVQNDGSVRVGEV